MHTIQFSNVSFYFPGSQPILENISFSLSQGIVALAGPNGAGKTTLLRLMMREIAPLSGNVAWHGLQNYEWLPQSLGPATQSSGQEKMRRLTALFRESDAVLFLDEPETHLDTKNRRWLRDAIRRHRGLVVIASHDPSLLDDAETILHTEMRRVAVYRMRYAEYQSTLTHERELRSAKVDHAEHELKKSERERRIQFERQLGRSLNAAAKAPLAGIPRIARGLMKRNAEATLGKIVSKNRRRAAAETEALSALRREKGKHLGYRFDIPAVCPFNTLTVDGVQIYTEKSALWRQPVSFRAKAGDKVLIAGPNGCGKSMLFKALCGKAELRHTGNILRRPGEIRLMDSAHTGVDPAATPLDLALDHGIGNDHGDARRLLGAFGFAGEAVFRRFESLSAGEKMRLRIFLIGKSPRPVAAILSDEAETGLDFNTRQLYAAFLNAFPAIVLVASHDEDFVRSLSLTNRVVLDTNPVME